MTEVVSEHMRRLAWREGTPSSGVTVRLGFKSCAKGTERHGPHGKVTGSKEKKDWWEDALQMDRLKDRDRQ